MRIKATENANQAAILSLVVISMLSCITDRTIVVVETDHVDQFRIRMLRARWLQANSSEIFMAILNQYPAQCLGHGQALICRLVDQVPCEKRQAIPNLQLPI